MSGLKPQIKKPSTTSSSIGLLVEGTRAASARFFRIRFYSKMIRPMTKQEVKEAETFGKRSISIISVPLEDAIH